MDFIYTTVVSSVTKEVVPFIGGFSRFTVGYEMYMPNGHNVFNTLVPGIVFPDKYGKKVQSWIIPFES